MSRGPRPAPSCRASVRVAYKLQIGGSHAMSDETLAQRRRRVTAQRREPSTLRSARNPLTVTKSTSIPLSTRSCGVSCELRFDELGHIGARNPSSRARSACSGGSGYVVTAIAKSQTSGSSSARVRRNVLGVAHGGGVRRHPGSSHARPADSWSARKPRQTSVDAPVSLASVEAPARPLQRQRGERSPRSLHLPSTPRRGRRHRFPLPRRCCRQ